MEEKKEKELNNLTVTENKDYLLDKPIDYQPCLIESFGENALEYVLKAVKKGYSERKIASQLSEIYNTKIVSSDVREVLDTNSKVMAGYMNHVNDSMMMRANLILKESGIMVEDVERLEKVAQELEMRMKQAISTKDLVAVGNTLSNLSRVRMDMVKNFKKLTGQYTEGPMINIDNSKTEIVQNNNSAGFNEISEKLKKELSSGNFNDNVNQNGRKEVIDVTEEDYIED